MHNRTVELASNLVWAVVALFMGGTIYRAVRRGKVLLPMPAAMMLALLMAFILLPTISVSDDLMAAKQSGLPLSRQTWKIASDDATTGFAGIIAPNVMVLIVVGFMTTVSIVPRDQWGIKPLAERLARAQRLRPPPFAVR